MKFELDLDNFTVKYFNCKKTIYHKNIILGLEGKCWFIKSNRIASGSNILNAYIKSGADLSGRLEGNFLIVILDTENRKLTVYTDLVSSIPLYYRVHKNKLACFETINPKIIKPNLSKKALAQYQKLGFIPGPYSIYKSIRKISPGKNTWSAKENSFIASKSHCRDKTSLTESLKDIQRNILNFCGKDKAIIVATGGLDSSLIAHLIKKIKPAIYFGAAIDKESSEYNSYCIKRCQTIANKLGLDFHIIEINKDEYLKNFVQLNRLLDEPMDEDDLPAVFCLFKKIRSFTKAKSIIISGMGNNEIFDLNQAELKDYIYKKMPVEIAIHKMMAKHFNLDFYAPYLNISLANYAFDTPLKIRRNKQSLKNILKKNNTLPRAAIDQISNHSQVPQAFLNPILKMGHRHSYRDIALKFWNKLKLSLIYN